MSDDQDRIAKEERARYWRESEKQKIIIAREWAYLVIAVLVAAMLVWALWSWRNVNNQTGATQAKLNAVIDEAHTTLAKVNEKIDQLGGEGTATFQAVRARVDALAPVETNLAALEARFNRETAALSGAVQARLQTVDGLVVETQHQIKQNGDAARDLLAATTKLADKFGVTADQAAQVLTETSKNLGVSMDALAKRINDHRLDDILDSAAKSANEANATLVDFHADLHNTMKQMPDIAADIHKTTTNIARYSRVSIIVSIFSRLASALIPGLLN